jgi:hypothetical protein
MSDYRLIPLGGKHGRGKSTIVDASLYDELKGYGWFVTSQGYVARTLKQKLQYMHRVLINPPQGMQVDHINGDKLDNRLSNLRICTRSENTRNAGSHTGSSRYKGVLKIGNRWRAAIRVNRQPIYLGHHSSEEDAAKAYDAAARKYFGKFARLNFPLELESQ